MPLEARGGGQLARRPGEPVSARRRGCRRRSRRSTRISRQRSVCDAVAEGKLHQRGAGGVRIGGRQQIDDFPVACRRAAAGTDFFGQSRAAPQRTAARPRARRRRDWIAKILSKPADQNNLGGIGDDPNSTILATGLLHFFGDHPAEPAPALLMYSNPTCRSLDAACRYPGAARNCPRRAARCAVETAGQVSRLPPRRPILANSIASLAPFANPPVGSTVRIPGQ